MSLHVFFSQFFKYLVNMPMIEVYIEHYKHRKNVDPSGLKSGIIRLFAGKSTAGFVDQATFSLDR